MITRTLPRKLSELGRIRIGDREPNSSGRGTHPRKLEAFRLTSPNGALLNFAASLYGGEVRPWEGEGAPRDDYGRPTQWEIYTQANSLDVLVPTMSAISLDYELWSAAGCQRRCNGVTISHCPLKDAVVGQRCLCPEDDLARAEQARVGKACARILRLNVVLPDLPGMGTWRLETKGFYATAELLGTLDLLRESGAEHAIIEAVLRLEQRTVKRPGKGEGKGTLKFVVPVLWPKYTPRQLLATAAKVLLAGPAPQPHLEAAKSLTQHIGEMYGEPRIPAHTALEAAQATAIGRQIDTLLTAQGVSADEAHRWWERMAERHRDFTPGILTMLYEHLQVRAAHRHHAETEEIIEADTAEPLSPAEPPAPQAPGEAP